LVFAALQVAGGALAAFDHAPRAVGQDLLELGLAGEAPERPAPQAARDGMVELVHEPAKPRCQRLQVEIGGE
jgi:hypothetical protein